MQKLDLYKLVHDSPCRVFGLEDAGNDAQRLIVSLLIQGFWSKDASILCEPSLIRSTKRPPDVVLVDTVAGIHVIEVKGHDLSQIDGIDPGGGIRFTYDNGFRNINPVAQVRSAMFDIKNAAERSYKGELCLPFKYWVVFPRIRRAEWLGRWGSNAFCPPELLFTEDLIELAARLRNTGERQLANSGRTKWPSAQIAAIWKAFGDSSVLYHRPEEREARSVEAGMLGEYFDEAAETYKTLTDGQQRLSEQNWNGGPRLIRGVAGSGKTIVLANNLARRIQRNFQEVSLFFEYAPRQLVVCNNRSLVPLLQKKISLAFQQRTGRPLPEKGLDIRSFNRLLFYLSQKGLWRYQLIKDGSDEERASEYLKELAFTKRHHPEIFEAVAYDAIYVDEGQDFVEDHFRLLKELCRVKPEQEPNLYVFYDDAQNFLGRKRPNWHSIGLKIRGGRAHIMMQCFRNTCPIVEAAFNVLYGSFANGNGEIPTKEFGDLATLEMKNAIVREKDGFWRVGFAVRDGQAAKLTMALTPAAEINEIVARLCWLIEKQRVRPQDILVLAYTRRRIEAIASELLKVRIAGVEGLHIAFREQDVLLGQRSLLTLSTTASAKGYDAYCVLLASANEFERDVIGRINFYVGCTRAIEYLEVFSYRNEGLAQEFELVLERQRAK